MANERRLIDANELPVTTLTGGGDWMKDVVYKSDVDAAPTVDAVEVVRCAKCTMAEFDSRYSRYKCTLSDVRYRWANDFCSYGRQREDV